jgi:hypothetical protein
VVEINRAVEKPPIAMHHLVSEIIPSLRCFTGWHVDGDKRSAHDFSIIEDFREKLFGMRFIHHGMVEKAPVFRQERR